MAVNRAIPGQLRDEEMQAIELLARLVPKGGQIVEVGSLLGLSSWIWAKNAAEGVTVHCLDPWELAGGGNFQKLASSHRQTFTRDQFLRNVADCDNIQAHRGFSPQDFQDWAQPVDLYFEDAVHTDPILAQNLAFWSGRLAPAGIVSGHDYVEKFADVRRGARALARSLGRRLQVIGSLWFALPAEAAYREAAERRAIVEALDALAARHRPGALIMKDEIEEAVALIGAQGPMAGDIEIAARGSAPEGGGTAPAARGVFTNRSAEAIPCRINETVYAEIGYEIYEGGVKAGTGRIPVDGDSILPGQAIPFEIPLDPLPPKDAQLKIGLLYRHAMWLDRKGIASKIVKISDMTE
ncbi:class I SAM-dependent methyltransferase [Methylobacterium organophilum]|nr:class I SAM-dependent methyltransferase [Methylobacterium organophilum]